MDDDPQQDHELIDAASLLRPYHARRLTQEEAEFIKRLARDGVAGRHVLCLAWHAIVALGKLALALSAIIGAIAIASGWRVHS